jgi:hypothetical protein
MGSSREEIAVYDELLARFAYAARTQRLKD